jgi:murein DD-endopeptidase MepM/ murein hydrolase activator NlpD
VVLEWTDRNGYHNRPIPFEIVTGRYRSEKLRVQPRKASPQPSDLDRIRQEKEAVGHAYRQGVPARLWKSPFQMPTDGPVTSAYGSRRLFNGKTRSYHNGVDFRAPVGTPIYAANTGIVLLAENLFYSGNVVILDHGAGVFTGYSHLSAFSVNTGDFVDKGRQIGLAGRTGRTSGPHLHWGAKVTGVNVDPLQLIEQLNSLFSPRAEKNLAARPAGDGDTPNR